ncbi:MAG TPA: hypothetical protein VFV87_23010 [Pirellulaceae bacterium]|nr:hypothetical protein [Pirellulaceae bacterium]
MSPLLPLAGTAALSLARETVGAIGNGLSFATELLRQDRRAASPTEPEPNAVATSDASARFEEALCSFVARLKQRLAAAGVGLNDPLELTDDGLGGIQVAGDRFDRAEIEQLLAADRQLVSEFQRLAEQQQALAADAAQMSSFALRITSGEAEVVAG